MGGAILIECMRQGVFTNKPSVVLLAPAFKKVYCGSFGSVSEDSIKKSYGEELRRCYDEIAQQKMKRIVIIHGREDQVIPLCDSEELASSINAELMVVEGVEGNHSLNDYLLDGPMPDRAEGQKRFDKLREVVQSVAI